MASDGCLTLPTGCAVSLLEDFACFTACVWDFGYIFVGTKGVSGVQNVKCTFVQALRLCTGRMAHRGSRGISLLFHDHDTRRGEGSASRPGRSLYPGKSRYPLYRWLGGP